MVTVDFVGRVGNTPLSSRQGLLPLFEAIFNSIQAIQEANNDNGIIQIKAIRDVENLLLNDEEQIRISPIIGFEIIDNGIGFTPENYESFNTSDSQKKINLGGKGVGRLLWLKAFDQVNIFSIFRQDGEINERSFDFILSNDPLINHRCNIISRDTKIETKISLLGLKSQFLEHIPRRLDVVAYRIIEHCLEFFVLGIMPKILIEDEDETIDLINIYNEMVSDNGITKFRVHEQEFLLIHFMLKAHTGMSHKLNYCAVHRVVESKKIDSRLISNLPSKIPSPAGNEEFIYMAYLSSPYFDSHVNQQRTGFDLFSEDQIHFLGELPWNEIEEKTIYLINEYLQPITKPLNEEKWQKVKEYVQNEAPQYRSLLKYKPDAINGIAPDIHLGKIDLELYKIQKNWELELREKAHDIIYEESTVVNSDEFSVKEKYSKFLEEWNENGKSALAKYVVHRKITLDILEKCMQSGEAGKYAKEKTIHQLIFPLKKTSDEIGYEQQNLWVIDEKLAFHHYLSSDVEIRQIEELESTDRERPDLLIFDNPIAVVDSEPINGITIIEFKRPMRSNSNPVSQMLGYVRNIRKGKECNNHGRPINVVNSTPFYCYAICDLQEQLRYNLEDMGMMKTPDNEGFFFYNPSLRVYVEVISYDKLLLDAKKRNKALFDQLNIK